MKIILNGANGRMGRILTDMIGAREDMTLAARVDRFGEADFAELSACDTPADIVIDFSNHAATADLLACCEARGMAVIIATTGQTEEERMMINEAAKAIPIFFSANMSIGIALLAELARKAAAVLPDADIEIIERHHNQKLDVPSGTALLLARRIGEVRENAQFVVGRHENGKRRPCEIGIHSLRYGSEVGTHEIILSTGKETVTLKHEAENRALFAEGALAAARFMAGKDAGLYDMRDIVGRE